MQIPADAGLELHDFEPDHATFLADVLAGLRRRPRTLPCKYFYDERGSALFDAICGLPEYYPTRTELAIMRDHAKEMAETIGSGCLLIEYGSGSSVKTRLLLDQLDAPAGYVPVDISREHLRRAAERISTLYPDLAVMPVCADFTEEHEIPDPPIPASRRVVYFPGSTIGNFEHAQARGLLRHVARECGAGGGFLVGVDLQKDPDLLRGAYDDGAGVTAAFNRNLLLRINRELGADFDPEAFGHRAIWNARAGRIEMHLVAEREQSARLAGETFRFARGETIHTESSHKYTLAGFAELARVAGLSVERVWTDGEDLFSVQYLEVA